jgi:uncharacterized protein (TIGR00290 family)
MQRDFEASAEVDNEGGVRVGFLATQIVVDMHCGEDDAERISLLAVDRIERKQQSDGVRSARDSGADAVAGAEVFAREGNCRHRHRLDRIVSLLWCDGWMEKTLLSWSGGKDSAWALHLLRSAGEFEVAALVTTLNEKFRRVAIHGFREALLDRQAELVGLPLWKVDLPFPCTNAIYEEKMSAVYARAAAEGFTRVAFGDLFLEEIRAYRVEKLADTGLAPIFPVWGIPTNLLAEQMLAGGLRARLTCVDPRKVPAEFAGREWDRNLLADLPEGVDPCGENGEFHSFAWAGPMFAGEIPVKPGERVERDGFVFSELIG